MALVSLEDFQASIYWDSNRGWTEAQVLQALSFGEDRFYKRTLRQKYGYWLEPVVDEVTLHGTGLPVIRCYYPIVSLTSVVSGGLDITDDVKIDHSHFLYRKTKGATFGTIPTDIASTVYADIVVNGVFGDPAYVKGDPPTSTVSWDVKNCIMRMASYQLLRERQQLDRTRDRAGQIHTRYIDVSNDPTIISTILEWTVHDLSGMVDFR